MCRRFCRWRWARLIWCFEGGCGKDGGVKPRPTAHAPATAAPHSAGMTAIAIPASRTVPLIVAVALLMENIDGSVLSTSLPAIATDLGSDPIHLKLVLTTYLLALAVFIPASGWAADRFGARLVFGWAIVVFAAGSIACGLSNSLLQLVGARTLQGIGGSLMEPGGRLTVRRAVPRDGLSRSLQFTAFNAIACAEVGAGRLSQATSFTAVAQQVSGSVGITIAAMGLEAVGWLRGVAAVDAGNFPVGFGVVAALAAGSALAFARLGARAGGRVGPALIH